MNSSTEKDLMRDDFNRAIQLYQGGDATASIQIMEKLAQQFPDSAPVFGYLGALHAHLGHYQEAISCARRALIFSPKSVSASRILIVSLRKIGDIGGALEEIERFLSIANSAEHNELYDVIMRQFSGGDETRHS